MGGGGSGLVGLLASNMEAGPRRSAVWGLASPSLGLIRFRGGFCCRKDFSLTLQMSGMESKHYARSKGACG